MGPSTVRINFKSRVQKLRSVAVVIFLSEKLCCSELRFKVFGISFNSRPIHVVGVLEPLEMHKRASDRGQLFGGLWIGIGVMLYERLENCVWPFVLACGLECFRVT